MLGARMMATKAEKKKIGELMKREVTKKRKIKPEWTFADYLAKKDPKVTYVDDEIAGWTLVSSMAIQRCPRLQQFDPSWFVEWMQFQDELDLKRKKVVPLDWITNRKAKDEDNARTFAPNPRITPSDRADDRRCLHRALDTSTFLLIKTKGIWGFPEGVWLPSETIRETAEKHAKELCGLELDTYLLGNAPIAHLEFTEEKKKWFLMHNLYVGGNFKLGHADVTDYAWASKYEFHQYFKDPKMLDLLANVFYLP